jgi:hypothetical protein
MVFQKSIHIHAARDNSKALTRAAASTFRGELCATAAARRGGLLSVAFSRSIVSARQESDLLRSATI